ncbi:GPALPP motifs-containing protein 1 [Musca autumnalis]|uniref:GPALPP motifs-containing protein 1 n=1 Tax=Musca autumnalis TaxID=221902 RepID=UPI003CE87AE8
MSTDSDSSTTSSSSSSDYERKRKLKKKHKKKSKKHKKEKKSRKEKKSSYKDSKQKLIEIQPIAPPRDKDATDEIESFGAALPPHLMNRPTVDEKPSVIGPVLPKNISLEKVSEEYPTQDLQKSHESSSEKEEHQESLYGTYGPVPDNNGQEISATQMELEKRALELKMAALDGILPGTSSADQTVREEWMLELPDVGMKGGLAALNNLKRGFYQGKERPDFSDRSSWTKTPQSAENERTKPTTSKESLKAHAQALYDKQRDEEQESMAKKYKKKHKRDESLVDIHQKKLRKEEKRKAKEIKESGLKPERRPFSRDIDLKLNKIDKNQTKQIVDKARLLDTKFSTGHTKYL